MRQRRDLCSLLLDAPTMAVTLYGVLKGAVFSSQTENRRPERLPLDGFHSALHGE